MSNPEFFVGTFTVREGVFHHVSYETAAWRSEITLDPGFYEVLCKRDHIDGRPRFFARIPGTITYEYTPILLGGVPTGKDPQGFDHRNVGKRTEVIHSVRPNDFRHSPEFYELVCQTYFTASRAVRETKRMDGSMALETYTISGLKFIPQACKARSGWRIDVSGNVTEFCSDMTALVERINFLSGQGYTFEVWSTHSDEHVGWTQFPYSQHLDYTGHRESPGHRYFLPTGQEVGAAQFGDRRRAASTHRTRMDSGLRASIRDLDAASV